ncbi:MAG: hypothetical protein FWE08_09065, partial [Oscillospiraceae bacterium]|nr:hypothetical protein [Oscillospiraceae bacterium]
LALTQLTFCKERKRKFRCMCAGGKKGGIRLFSGHVPENKHHNPPQRPGPQAGSLGRQSPA